MTAGRKYLCLVLWWLLLPCPQHSKWWTLFCAFLCCSHCKHKRLILNTNSMDDNTCKTPWMTILAKVAVSWNDTMIDCQARQRSVIPIKQTCWAFQYDLQVWGFRMKDMQTRNLYALQVLTYSFPGCFNKFFRKRPRKASVSLTRIGEQKNITNHAIPWPDKKAFAFCFVQELLASPPIHRPCKTYRYSSTLHWLPELPTEVFDKPYTDNQTWVSSLSTLFSHQTPSQTEQHTSLPPLPSFIPNVWTCPSPFKSLLEDGNLVNIVILLEDGSLVNIVISGGLPGSFYSATKFCL